MASSTELHRLARRAVQLGATAETKRLLERLTTITGGNDPQLTEKLAALDPATANYIARRLCEIIEAVP